MKKRVFSGELEILLREGSMETFIRRENVMDKETRTQADDRRNAVLTEECLH